MLRRAADLFVPSSTSDPGSDACYSGRKDNNRGMSNPVLTIEHLRVDFPGVVAVNDLSLTIEAGDVCGLIGPNGAGKTTTMRAVSGLQECTRGTVRWMDMN